MNVRYFLGIAGAALLASLVVSAIRIARMVPEGYELTYGEGLVLWMAQHATSPSTLYHSIDRSPFLVGVYPPVFPLAISALQSVVGDVRLAGRILAAAAFVGILATVAVLARDAVPQRYGRDARWGAAFAAAGLAASASALSSFPPAVRVDGPGLWLTLTGLWIFLSAPASSPRQYGALAVLVLAAFTKQSFISAIATCLGITLVTAPARAARLLLFTVATAALPMAALQLASGGEFLAHVTSYTRSEMSLARLLKLLVPNVREMLPVLALAAIAVLWQKRSLLAFDRSALRRLANNSQRRYMAALVLYLVLTFMASWTAGKVGSGEYYFMEWNAAACIVAGVAIGVVIAESGKPHRARPMRVAFSCIILVVMAALNLATATNNAFRLTRGARALAAARQAETDQAVAFVRASTLPIVSEDLSLLVMTGRELPIEPFIMWELARQGRWNPAPFIEALNRRSYGALIFEGDVARSELVPGNILSAMLSNYRHVNDIGRYWVYEPH
jgi:hypothetical protein